MLAESLEWWESVLTAQTQRESRQLLDQLIVMNRAFHADADAWQAIQRELANRADARPPNPAA